MTVLVINLLNGCFFNRKGIQLAHVGECTTLKESEQCPEDCNDVPEEPVCGSDGNVYRYECIAALN